MKISIEIDEDFIDFEHPEEMEWFEKSVLTPGDLSLHSNEIGDTVGDIIKISNITFIPRPPLPNSEQNPEGTKSW